ncbi:chromate efflux transporter [Massilia sp. DWR3-1-1]|uniref:chromate efflux transporter n=1 Tax=Massilia sp. DWR3-1-1 TaxID=2804559 RepID=UPI003CF30FA1
MNTFSELPRTDHRPAPVSLWEAVGFWFKLGWISFGGPAGQIAMMHLELVERRRWISERRFLHALNYCMLLPGPEATQLAVYIGWLMHRSGGAIVAGTLFVLPSLLILIALSTIYMAFGAVPAVAGVLDGIKPAVVAIVLGAAWRLGRRTLKHPLLLGIAALSFIAIAVGGVPFPLIVLGAALIGVAGARLRPQLFRAGGPPAGAAGQQRPALIDDDTPPPPHAQFGWRRLARTAGVGVGLGLLSWGWLAWRFGAAGALAQMGWFFTKAAMLTFGGAYAVLPYVYQGAVAHFHWLSGAQMVDGLALGETTPGPLIMVVAFVGFVGAWQAALFGEGTAALFWSGAAGALVATWFTFLPSFIFILAGGPLVEASRDDVRMTAPLTAIAAAVVGVIVSLALFFGQHVFVRDGHPDWQAVAIGVVAAVALFGFRTGPIKLIAACALAGLVLSYRHV